jgi:hypothetical protein
MLLAIASPLSHAGLTALDDFNYAPIGSDLNTKDAGGSFGFTGPWSGQTSYNIASGSLLPSRDPLPPVGNSVSAVAFGENRGIDRTLSTSLGTEDTTAYVSILMQPKGILHQGAFNGWFALALRGSTDVVAGMSSFGEAYSLEVGFEKSSTTTNAVIGRTVFIVLRIDFTEGVDPVYMYMNPQPGAPEPTTPSASLINLNVNFISHVSLTGPGGSGFDALRIGTSFADVAPATTDFNADSRVDVTDLAAWRGGFGATGAAMTAQGDANFDSNVDGADFLTWQRQHGFQLPSGGAAVPEPGGLRHLALIAIGTASIARRRMRASFAAEEDVRCVGD